MYHMAMKKKPPLTTLNFDTLVDFLRGYLGALPDTRRGRNQQYTIADAALSAFSVFFMQSPSFLAHQRQMASRSGQDNVRSLFHAEAVPSDNQIRNLLDPIPSGVMTPVFEHVFQTLQTQGYLKPYGSIQGTHLLALDGTRYFSSGSIHCERCQQTHGQGKVTYSHSVITPTLVAPGVPHVITLPPEFIHHQDGVTKQDCEITAAKRWLGTHASRYKDLTFTLLGDDLYSHQPFVEALTAQGHHFIFTAKPDSHKILYEWVREMDGLGKVNTVTRTRREGRKHFTDTYRFLNAVPLRDGEDAREVNWCELVTVNEKGKRTFINGYVTDHLITTENVVAMVAAGRTRWKIENEQFNTLKTKGYHLEHNFGHGKQYLSELLFTFNLIAFLYHTVLHLADRHYQVIRERLGTRKTFFEHVRTLTYYQCFQDWGQLMTFMVTGLELEEALLDTS